MEAKISAKEINLVGIAAWKFVPSEPRHNTFHQAISTQAISQGLPIQYLGLKNTIETDWVCQVLPDTVLKRIPYMSPLAYLRVIRSLKLDHKAKTVIYTFEGSFSWLILLKLISRFIPNSTLVCNLFPSSKYSKILFVGKELRTAWSLVFQLLGKRRDLHLTFDTHLMVNKVNQSMGQNQVKAIFPLPSALPYLPHTKFDSAGHHRVLVNMRDFQTKELHELLSNSCQQCTFVFPRGPLASTPMWVEFGNYQNLAFDKSNIPVEEYLNYVDQFDYMIFLYEPSINSSGRILDAIVRRIPVCIPVQASEWCATARDYGELHEYDWTSTSEKSGNFNHPSFSSPLRSEVPKFTPSGAIANLSNFAKPESDQSRVVEILNIPVTLLIITSHWIISMLINNTLGLLFLFRTKTKRIK